jgi:hypothetical protein
LVSDRFPEALESFKRRKKSCDKVGDTVYSLPDNTELYPQTHRRIGVYSAYTGVESQI